MRLHVLVATLACGVSAAGAGAQTHATQWDFTQGDLASSFGQGTLSFWDRPETGVPGSAQSATRFGTTSSFGIAPIGLVDAPVMRVPAYLGTQGIICRHGAPANGGGLYLNEFSIVFDIYFDSDDMRSGSGWFPFFNTHPANTNDADAYFQFSAGIGISGEYAGIVLPDMWHRIALTFDLNEITGPRFIKYIDGVFAGWQILNEGLDARWAMFCVDDPNMMFDDQFLLFSEPKGLYTASAYISSIYFVDRPLNAIEVALLGLPDADGIVHVPNPTCPCDWNLDDILNTADIFDFLGMFFGGQGDFNGDGATSSQDFFDFLNCFFAFPNGCQ